MPRQYVACKFRESDAKPYTFHNDGEPVTKGDRVIVISRGREVPATVFAVLGEDAPPYATNEIIGKAPPPAEIEPEPEAA